MRHIPRQRGALPASLAAVAMLAICAAAAPALASGSAPVAPAAGLPDGSAPVAASSRAVLLINGDELITRPTPGGGRAITLRRAAGATGGVIGLKLGSLTDEIPADALPYLGRGLDPSLFELTALQRTEKPGRLPVRVSFQGKVPALPGVKITRVAAGSAEGYLTASSARTFGAALARQFRADHARASYGTDGLFGRGVDIALAGTTSSVARTVRPDFLMHTLTVTGTDLTGRRDNGDLVWVFNAGDVAKFGDPIESSNFFYHGAAKFSVPAGTYWAIGDFFNFSGDSASERLAVLPQFAVTRNTTVHVAERAANSEITTATPRPAVTQVVNFQLIRGGVHGTSNSFTWSDIGLNLWVSPTTRKPTVGTLQSFTSATLTSPPGATGTPYAYNLDYAGADGIIPAQHYVAQPASLATVNEQYYQDVGTTGAWSNFGGFAAQLVGLIFSLELPLNLPGLQTQYFSAGPAVLWSSSYSEFSPVNFFPWGGQGDDSFRALPAGQQQTVGWNRYPLHPQPYVSPGGLGGREFPLEPSAFRTGDTLQLDTTPFSDNQPEHVGAGFFVGPGATVSGSYQIAQNGARIAGGNAVNGIPAVRLSSKPSVIRFTLTATRTGPFPLSTSSQTVWTWRSARQPKATVPANWFCGYVIVRQEYKLLRQCAVQPMMTLDYQVQGLALNGSTAPGGQVIDFNVGHLQLAKALAVTGVTAQVSYNDGQSWLDVPVAALGGRNFSAAFSAPGGVDVTLRVTATDSAGGSISETILRAYGVSF